jgi:hypothetical protein
MRGLIIILLILVDSLTCAHSIFIWKIFVIYILDDIYNPISTDRIVDIDWLLNDAISGLCAQLCTWILQGIIASFNNVSILSFAFKNAASVEKHVGDLCNIWRKFSQQALLVSFINNRLSYEGIIDLVPTKIHFFRILSPCFFQLLIFMYFY